MYPVQVLLAMVVLLCLLIIEVKDQWDGWF